MAVSSSPSMHPSGAWRATLLCLPLLLAACSASQEPKEQTKEQAKEQTKEQANTACDASKADPLIGEYANGYQERQAMQRSGAGTARTLGPDDAATMDFNPNRINLYTDPGKVIIRLACG